jgi:acyl-[acyl carrier protein]--UDP-N-acetylglucosamine O-acyltransferase
VAGVNVVGMRRSGCTRESIVEVKTLFRRVYAESNPRAGAARLLAAGEARTDEGRRFLEFFGGGKRGVARPRRRDSEAHDREPTDEDRDNLR